MGMESGWNCHISLGATRKKDSEEQPIDESENVCSSLLRSKSAHICKNNRLCELQKCERSRSADETSLMCPTSSSSVPEMVSLAINRNIAENASLLASANTDNMEFGKSDVNSFNSLLSPIADSFQEIYELDGEHPTPLGFDMSNRAQLPTGIEEVRPHLENVDNVPLLVSLFTDCTPENECEMLNIMQDYGEVTLLLGSPSNADNKGVFLQADARYGVILFFLTCK